MLGGDTILPGLYILRGNRRIFPCKLISDELLSVKLDCLPFLLHSFSLLATIFRHQLGPVISPQLLLQVRIGSKFPVWPTGSSLLLQPQASLWPLLPSCHLRSSGSSPLASLQTGHPCCHSELLHVSMLLGMFFPQIFQGSLSVFLQVSIQMSSP